MKNRMIRKVSICLVLIHVYIMTINISVGITSVTVSVKDLQMYVTSGAEWISGLVSAATITIKN